MATLHINEKVGAKNCKKKKKYNHSADGPSLFLQALHRGPEKTEEGCLEALPPLVSSTRP